MSACSATVEKSPGAARAAASPRPGAICRCRGRPGPVLLLEPRGEGFEAVPYPVPLDFEAVLLPSSSLEPYDEDLASARVLCARRRSLLAAGPRRGPPPRPVRTAMVLCAGLGTRLRPLTAKFPKPAVPFFGAPLVRYSFALLRGAGVERVVINTHHLPEVMQTVAAAEAARLGLELQVSNEPVIQGTAGGIRDARRFLEDGPFLVLNGDAFMSLDLGDLLARHQEQGAAATLGVVPMPPDEQFGAVEAGRDGGVRRIAGHGPGGEGLVPWHFVGVHVIEPEAFGFMPGPGPLDINREVYPAMIAAGRRVQAAPVRLGAWADMGTPRRYLQACEEVMSGLCDLSGFGADTPLPEEAAARLRAAGPAGRLFVDPGAEQASTAIVERAQLGPGVRVGDGAIVRRACVLPGTRIAPGERIEDAIACDELRLPAG
jgi:mannose-1-phosphate guanylyltransferase